MERMRGCPFCGGKVKFWLNEKTWTYKVRCKECGCEVTHHATTAEEAIEKWNGRAHEKND